jgi:hypothetical protein
VGNLHQQGIREIWRSSAGLVEVRDLTVQVKAKLETQGPGVHLLNFCPGSAAAQTGSPLEVYAAASQRKELLEQVMGEEARRPLLPIVY